MGLPATLALIDADGRPTAGFLALFRAAYPSNDLGPRDIIISGRTPTRRFLAAWSAATA